MNNPLVNPKAMINGPWQQEMIWVQRNGLGHIVGYSEKLPPTDNFVPMGPRLAKKKAHQ